MSKGFELQFHWIFVLIAGALILAFFFSIAQKQKAINEQRLEFSISSELEGVLAAAISGKGSARIIPNPGVSFSCKEGCACTLNNKDAKELIFGLTSGGDTLSLWSKEVLMPYRVANLLFLTDQSVKYYFVGDPIDTMFNQLVKNIPAVQTKEGAVPILNYENKTLGQVIGVKAEQEHTRFVFTVGEPANIPLHDSFEDVEASAIKVEQNLVIFYEKEGLKFHPVLSVPRVDLAVVYAAILSKDMTMYKCGMQKLASKTEIVARVYKARAEILRDYTSSQSQFMINCPRIYDQLIANLEQQIGAAKLSGTFSTSIAGLAQNTDLLETNNRELVQKSCPELF